LTATNGFSGSVKGRSPETHGNGQESDFSSHWCLRNPGAVNGVDRALAHGACANALNGTLDLTEQISAQRAFAGSLSADPSCGTTIILNAPETFKLSGGS